MLLPIMMATNNPQAIKRTEAEIETLNSDRVARFENQAFVREKRGLKKFVLGIHTIFARNEKNANRKLENLLRLPENASPTISPTAISNINED